MKDESNIPKLRFKEFANADAWERRKFKDIFYYLQNNSLSRADLSNEIGDVLNIHYGDVLIKYEEILNVDRDKKKIPKIIENGVTEQFERSILKDGDIVIADAAEDQTVGKCTEIRGVSNVKVLAGLHTIPIRPREIFAKGYLGYFLNSKSFHEQLIPLMQGTKVLSISRTVLQDTVISYPKNKSEQNILGLYFANLDSLITLHQRKIDKLKNLKQAYLNDMFV